MRGRTQPGTLHETSLGRRAMGSGPTPPPTCSVKEGANKEVLGILVSYRVKVKLVVSRGG